MTNYRDIRCGKVICKNEEDNVLRIKSATTTYTNINGEICISVEYSTGNPNSANMWVKDGTVCGQNQVCRLSFPNNFLIYALILNACLVSAS